FYDQLFTDRLWDLGPLRHGDALAAHGGAIPIQPIETTVRGGYAVRDRFQAAAAFTHGHCLSSPQRIARDVHRSTIYSNVPVTVQLPCSTTCWRDPQTEHRIVQACFAQLEQHLTGDPTLAGRRMVHLLELAFQDAIGVLGLLLFTQLVAVFALL